MLQLLLLLELLLSLLLQLLPGRARQHLEKALNIYFYFKTENSQEVLLFEQLVSSTSRSRSRNRISRSRNRRSRSRSCCRCTQDGRVGRPRRRWNYW